jgi:hypothetical protein
MDKQWETISRFLAMLVIAFALALFGAAILPSLATSGKPRGNQLALFECRIYLNFASHTKTNSSNFEFAKLSDEDRHSAIVNALYLDFLIKTNFSWTKPGVVIVCTKKFDNVHKPGFWNSFFRNPAYAVGYSDGTTKLISPEDLADYNLKGFVSAANLATNSDFNIFKK